MNVKWPADLMNRCVPVVGVVVLVLTATTWVVEVESVDVWNREGTAVSRISLESHHTLFGLFQPVSGNLVVLLLVVAVLAFAAVCLSWPAHRSRAVVAVLGLLAALVCLVVIIGGGAAVAAWFTFMLGLLIFVAGVIDARVAGRT